MKVILNKKELVELVTKTHINELISLKDRISVSDVDVRLKESLMQVIEHRMNCDFNIRQSLVEYSELRNGEI